MLVAEKIKNWVFHQVHENNLVYNTCWEDPRCDRNLLKLDANSEVLMITSAGCNVLAYLLDNPRKIHSVDVNPRQNALLQLKLAFFKQSDYQTFFQFFGKGSHPAFAHIYHKTIRSVLEEYAQDYWDKHIDYFSPKGIRKSFYHCGTSGTFAWLVSNYLKTRKNLFQETKSILEATSMEEQRRIYNQIEPRILSRLLEALLNRHFTMCLLGVPTSQQELFMHEYYRGALGFIQSCLRHVFTELSVQDNYFYRIYLNGEYTEDCCPDYLKESNFEVLKERQDQLSIDTCSVSDYLVKNPGQYSHFVLLDHQDWLASNDKEALDREWDLILKNSRLGSKILFRSAGSDIDFIPDFAKERLIFEQTETKLQHQLDRVGTYASSFLAEVI